MLCSPEFQGFVAYNGFLVQFMYLLEWAVKGALRLYVLSNVLSKNYMIKAEEFGRTCRVYKDEIFFYHEGGVDVGDPTEKAAKLAVPTDGAQMPE
eukprot:5919753-Amphidinium_carterae.2